MAGWLTELPRQYDIPGWQRMTLLMYRYDATGVNLIRDSMWSYDGIALPGGQIIIGRWMHVLEGQYENPDVSYFYYFSFA